MRANVLPFIKGLGERSQKFTFLKGSSKRPSVFRSLRE